MKRTRKPKLSLSTETLHRVAGGEAMSAMICPASFGPECPTRHATCPTKCQTYCDTARRSCALCPPVSGITCPIG